MLSCTGNSSFLTEPECSYKQTDLKSSNCFVILWSVITRYDFFFSKGFQPDWIHSSIVPYPGRIGRPHSEHTWRDRRWGSAAWSSWWWRPLVCRLYIRWSGPVSGPGLRWLESRSSSHKPRWTTGHSSGASTFLAPHLATWWGTTCSETAQQTKYFIHAMWVMGIYIHSHTLAKGSSEYRFQLFFCFFVFLGGGNRFLQIHTFIWCI